MRLLGVGAGIGLAAACQPDAGSEVEVADGQASPSNTPPLSFPQRAIVRTVLGDVSPESLGTGATLFHEHVSFNYSSPPPPMVVDPPDGRIPLQPWAAARRNEIMASQDSLEHLDPRVKCLSAGLPRANTPVGYNSYQFLQVPGAVVILYEWNHLSRYIPLDERPHVSRDIQLGMGDSRGHWDGHTLVVDVTNFTDNLWPVGNGAPPQGAPASSITTGHGVFQITALHVVERFTPVDAETIHYEATITDPNVFTQPWTIAWNAFTRAPADHILYEYACHEGNGRNIKLLTGHDFDGVVLKLAK